MMSKIFNLHQFDVAIVGGGTMGLSAAYSLAQRGLKVAVLEQFDFYHALSSSRDYSRAFRIHYGDDLTLTQFAVEALAAWKNFEKREGRQFYHPCGKLVLGDRDDPYLRDCKRVMDELEQPAELLSGQEIQKRFPKLRADFGFLDVQGGVLDAQGYLDTLLESLAANPNVELIGRTRVQEVAESGVRLADGRWLGARQILVTAGPWVRNLVDVPVVTTKQQLLYFRSEQSEAFQPEHFPIFSFIDSGYYGLPQFGLAAVKVANHIPGVDFDANQAERRVDPGFIERTRDFLRVRIPSLADADILHSKVCVYTGTSDRHFVLEKISDRVLVATGFSGHGFKFSPWMGARLADMLTGEAAAESLDRFKLRRFRGPKLQQTVRTR